MDFLLHYLRTTSQRQRVRPWALLPTILVLLVALPLLRPLRVPQSQGISSNELSRLAVVESLAERGTQDIERTSYYAILKDRKSTDKSHEAPETVRKSDGIFSDKMPVLSFILAGYYSVLMWFGLTMEKNPVAVTYVLTLLGSTLPVAAAAGLLYRMGRLFELPRPWRTALAVAVIFGSGLITYAVVINAHAPAAAFVIAACACIVHLCVAKHETFTGMWMLICGLCASIATVIDLAAGVFLIGFLAVIVTMRWRKRMRFGGALMYLIGIAPPLILHAMLMIPLTGDMFPLYMHPEMRPTTARPVVLVPSLDLDDEPVSESGWIHRTAVGTEHVMGALIGTHGIVTHFPAVLLGIMGIVLVLRRHWPTATKTMALVTLSGGAIVILVCVYNADWTQAMFGPRWFIVFMPLMLFWTGAWLRKSHHAVTWTVAALLIVFSVTVSLIGTTNPFVITSPGTYSVSAAVKELMHPGQPMINPMIVASGD